MGENLYSEGGEALSQLPRKAVVPHLRRCSGPGWMGPWGWAALPIKGGWGWVGFKVTSSKPFCDSMRSCMGTVRPRPQPVIEHLGKGHTQPWEHRWKQFIRVTRRVESGTSSPSPHLGAGPGREGLLCGDLFSGVFGEP